MFRITSTTHSRRTEPWIGEKSGESGSYALRPMTFDPDWASPPGDTIADILHVRGMSVDDLANETGASPTTIDSVIQGRETITIGLARSLERAIGASREFWISRDFQYRRQAANLTGASEAWIRKIPISDMIRFGWLKTAPCPSEEVTECLRFFDVPSVQAWYDKYDAVLEVVAFRKSQTFDSWPGATAVWLRQGEIEGEKVECAQWDRDGFSASLLEIRRLTRIKQPRIFLPRLQRVAAAHGVAVVIVRLPAGCRASGATRFLATPKKKALVLLSFRHLSDDHFWFSFFHEAAHLLLHGDKKWILEGTGGTADDQEREANDFAANVLIPSAFREAFWTLRPNTRQVIRFARQIGISPGIVVGQMQHHGLVDYSQLNGLKRRYRWVTATHGMP